METLINSNVSNSVVEKIRKLLALASNLNDSKEQAEMAMKKAKELATAHEVDLACIQVFENKKSEEPIERGDISLGKRQSVCQKFISWLLQNHFNVRIIYTGGRYFGKQMVLVGKKSDIEIATYVNGFLNEEFMRLWQKYHRATDDSQVKDRNSYFWGLYNGLSDKLKEGAEAAKKTAFDTMAQSRSVDDIEKVKNCMAMTIVTDKERIDDAVGKMFGRLRRGRTYTRGSHNGSARDAGYNAGKKINLNRGLGAGGGGQIE